MTKTMVSVASTRGIRLYLTGVSFADGSGFKIKSFRMNPDVSKAAGFSLAAAEAIAQQLAPRYQVQLHRPNGVAETVTMTPEQLAQRQAAQKVAEDMNKFFAEAARALGLR